MSAGPPLRVLSWGGQWGKTLLAEVVGPFTAATGRAVVTVPHVGLGLPRALVAALEAGRTPPVDVVWSNTVPGLRAAARGWCRPLGGLAGLDGLRPRARDGVGPDWPLAPVYVVPYVLVYRTALYPGPPDRWSVLLDPRHAGRVVLYPGGNGLHPVAQRLGGGALAGIPDRMAPCWAAMARLGRQMAAPRYSIGLEAVIAGGEVDLLYRALPNALAFRQAGLAVDWTAPAEGVADTTDCLWLPRGIDPARAGAAGDFVAFALSAPVQERWCAALGAQPMNGAAAVPALLRSCGLSATADRTALSIPDPLKARYHRPWEARFAEITGCSPSGHGAGAAPPANGPPPTA